MKKILLLVLMLGFNISAFAGQSVYEIEQKCDEGDGLSCFALGVAWEYSRGVKEDYFKAVEYYEKACDLDNGLGCAGLGLMYGNGKVVQEDIPQALAHFFANKFNAKACDLGVGKSCYVAALMYEKGFSVKQSNAKALKYYGKGCDLKNQDGCDNYAKLKQKLKQ